MSWSNFPWIWMQDESLTEVGAYDLINERSASDKRGHVVGVRGKVSGASNCQTCQTVPTSVLDSKLLDTRL